MRGSPGEAGLKDGKIRVKGRVCSAGDWTAAAEGLVRAEARAGASDWLDVASCALCGVGKTLATSRGTECGEKSRDPTVRPQ